MVRRTRREEMYKLLEENKEWNIVDIASSNAGWKYADVFVDIVDYSNYYKQKYNGEKKFIQGDVETNLFRDKEFDFVIASHILEHVNDPNTFINELVRIGKRGYIEVPTPLWDNLATGPKQTKYGHKWWVTFDDVDNHIVINKKINVVNLLLSPKEHNKHMVFFRDTIVTQLYWEDNVEIKMGNGIYRYYDNRDIDETYDSNQISDWDGKYLFEFGKLK